MTPDDYLGMDCTLNVDLAEYPSLVLPIGTQGSIIDASETEGGDILLTLQIEGWTLPVWLDDVEIIEQ